MQWTCTEAGWVWNSEKVRDAAVPPPAVICCDVWVVCVVCIHSVLEGYAEEKEELLLVFTHLDPNDHQREFQLGVHVVADNRYTGARLFILRARIALVMRRRLLYLATHILQDRQRELIWPLAFCMCLPCSHYVSLCSDEVPAGAAGSGAMSGGAQ